MLMCSIVINYDVYVLILLSLMFNLIKKLEKLFMCMPLMTQPIRASMALATGTARFRWHCLMALIALEQI